MKLTIVFLSLASFVATEEPRLDTAYGYLKRFGVPLAEKILIEVTTSKMAIAVV